MTGQMLAGRIENTDFEVGVSGVTLASSLIMSVKREPLGASACSSGGRFDMLVDAVCSDSSSASLALLASAMLMGVLRGVIQSWWNQKTYVPPLSVICFVVGLYLLRQVIVRTLLCERTVISGVYLLWQVAFSSSRKAASATPGALPPLCYSLRICEHRFTSPDAPIKDADDEIPQRFIVACERKHLSAIEIGFLKCLCVRTYRSLGSWRAGSPEALGPHPTLAPTRGM